MMDTTIITGNIYDYAGNLFFGSSNNGIDHLDGKLDDIANLEQRFKHSRNSRII